MEKRGVHLNALPGFPSGVANLLREEFSVTTAEEFVDLATRAPEGVRRAIDVTSASLDQLVRTAGSSIATRPEDAAKRGQLNAHRYRTGHDAPAARAKPADRSVD